MSFIATIPHVGDLFNSKNPSTTSLIGHQSLKVVINNDVPPILDEPIKSDVGDISRMPASCKEHVGDQICHQHLSDHIDAQFDSFKNQAHVKNSMDLDLS